MLSIMRFLWRLWTDTLSAHLQPHVLHLRRRQEGRIVDMLGA